MSSSALALCLLLLSWSVSPCLAANGQFVNVAVGPSRNVTFYFDWDTNVPCFLSPSDAIYFFTLLNPPLNTGWGPAWYSYFSWYYSGAGFAGGSTSAVSSSCSVAAGFAYGDHTYCSATPAGYGTYCTSALSGTVASSSPGHQFSDGAAPYTRCYMTKAGCEFVESCGGNCVRGTSATCSGTPNNGNPWSEQSTSGVSAAVQASIPAANRILTADSYGWDAHVQGYGFTCPPSPPPPSPLPPPPLPAGASPSPLSSAAYGASYAPIAALVAALVVAAFATN